MGYRNSETGSEIAVIGMAGRFPGAKNIDEFWENLKNGVESISFFSDAELKAARVEPDLIKNPDYIKAYGILEDIEYFDPVFFDYTSREAEIMDPQMRIFHECVWIALENAGYNPEFYKGLIGLYAGASHNLKWEALSILSGKREILGQFAAETLDHKDFLSTRISYKFGLKGPSFSINTACSTSLVAIHLACQSLLNGECDIALAGGITILALNKNGYLYREGMIASPDGHCRTFGSRAEGTVGGEGAGVVVLKRLEDTVLDGDYTYAVIKGSAINNDGIRKVGFTAPSIEGQAEAIRMAQHMAEVEPEMIGYIEAHGTGTILGDPAEVEALKLAFNTKKKGFCKIGSVKTNIGHLDSAAGVAGFIKTVLALKYKLIPASLHFEDPNPKIDFENSPFLVNTNLTEWENGRYPLRAGVSSFGIGGTNAHVVLEEAPEIEESSPGRHWKLMVLSARTESALNEATGNLAGYFKENPGINLSDAAYTLQVGRKPFQYRRISVCRDADEAIEALSSPDSGKVQEFSVKGGKKPVIFMFPGQGSQYVEMGLGLYQTEPVFREELDRCFGILKSLMGYDIKEILYPGLSRPPRRIFARAAAVESEAGRDERHLSIDQTEVAQVVLFIFEYALAKLLIEWGITPHAMTGHSIGEYTAACLSGVFSLEDALKLVAARGQLMQQLPAGSMLSVPLPEDELKPMLNEKLSLAAVNSSSLCVISGSHEDMEGFEKVLKERGCEGRRLHTSHAFHSKMIDPVLGKFEEKVRGIKLNRPDIPYISNLTGRWIDAEDAVEPGYWARHLRETVRFANGLGELLKEEGAIFVEVGPGKALSIFLRRHMDRKPGQFAVDLIRHPQEEIPDHFYLLSKIGQLWLYGAKINWAGFYAGEKRRRIPMPTYPFERQRYWIDGDMSKISEAFLVNKFLSDKKPDMADWFYVPLWEQSILDSRASVKPLDQSHWLVFIDETGWGGKLADRLKQDVQSVIIVKIGAEFTKVSDDIYTLNPRREDDYDKLFDELLCLGRAPGRIVHLWGVSEESEEESMLEGLDWLQELGLHSLLNIVRATGRQNISDKIQIEVVTNNVQEVNGEEVLCPLKATVLGAVKIIPLEYPHISCRSIDIVLPESGGTRENKLIEHLTAEFTVDSPDNIVVYRGNKRWVQNVKPVGLDESHKASQRLREKGVYLITGGLGGMGFTFAQHLARSVKARLILVGRSNFPGRERWQEWLQNHEIEDDVSRKIRKIDELEDHGAEIMVASADISNREQVEEVIALAEKRFGCINGVLHTAGIADYAGVIQKRTKEMTEDIMAPKVKGTLVLDTVFKGKKLDFFVLFSSVGNVTHRVKFGQIGYTAANEFLDAYAHYKTIKDNVFTVSINWEDWQEVGMSVEAVRRRFGEKENRESIDYKSVLRNALSPTEGVAVWERILGSTLPRVVLSTLDLGTLIKKYGTPGELEAGWLGSPGEQTSPGAPYVRSDLSTVYVAPRNETEQELTEIFQEFFGIDQVGIDDDFFELGGDSLKAMILVARINKNFHVKIPLGEIFRRATIKEMASLIPGAERREFVDIEKTEKRDFYHTTYNHTRLWIIQQFEPGNTAYNMIGGIKFEERIDVEAVQRSLEAIVDRHESFRTGFREIGGEPVQFIAGKVNIPLELIDLSSLSGEEKIEKRRQVFYREYTTPFDLSKPPLLRAAMLRLDNQHHELIFSIHHIISDGWSQEILKREFLAVCDGYRKGRRVKLAPINLQYRDFAWWQHKQLRSLELKEKAHRYWREKIKEGFPRLRLPFDFSKDGDRGAAYRFLLGRDIKEGVARLALDHHTTIFMVLFSAYYILLSRISGQKEVVCSIISSGREHISMQDIVGFFVNALPVKQVMEPEEGFCDFLQRVNNEVLEAFQYQNYPLELVLGELKVGYPEVSTAFNMFNTTEEVGKIGEGYFEPYHTDNVWNVKFDMALYVTEYRDDIGINWDYNASRYRPETIESVGGGYQRLLREIIRE